MSGDEHIRKMREHAEDPKKFAKDRLKALVERIERLNEEIRSFQDDKRDVYAEAKATGYSTRALKSVVKIRNYEREHGADARKSEDAILETYLQALGML